MRRFRQWQRWLPVALLALVVTSGVVQAQQTLTVRTTYYLPTGNPMATGQMPFVGAAACSTNFPFGTRLRFPDGRMVTCLDRGVLGASGWVDTFAPTPTMGRQIAQAYGDYAAVTVERWGYGED